MDVAVDVDIDAVVLVAYVVFDSYSSLLLFMLLFSELSSVGRFPTSYVGASPGLL